jgi:hypothetical protein
MWITVQFTRTLPLNDSCRIIKWFACDIRLIPRIWHSVTFALRQDEESTGANPGFGGVTDLRSWKLSLVRKVCILATFGWSVASTVMTVASLDPDNSRTLSRFPGSSLGFSQKCLPSLERHKTLMIRCMRKSSSV